MESLSDEELIARYRLAPGADGSRTCLETLFRRHQTRVAAWCYRFTGDRTSAADLAQEIFAKAYASLESFRADSKFTTWLYVIARNRWRFARAGREGVEPSADHVWLEGGFEAGKVYELTYTALGAPIVGLGFLAFRDAASFLKHGSAADGNPLAGAIEYAYAYGQSMNGRWLREFLYWGLNRDESARIAFDGMLPNTGSSRRGEFNLRFGQPSTNILRAPGNT